METTTNVHPKKPFARIGGLISQPIFHPAVFLSVLFWIMAGFSPSAEQWFIYDTFEDRDLNRNPAWNGDLNHFQFHNEENYTLLRLSAEQAGRSQIQTTSPVVFGSWSFYLRHEGFTPSNLNRAFIFLISDQPDLDYTEGSSVSGYALRFGDNQHPRRFRLVRFDTGTQTSLLESQTVIEQGKGYQITVTRSKSGEWNLSLAEGYDTPPLPNALPVTDNRYLESSVFGVLFRYTSSNRSGFYLGNIRVTGETADTGDRAKFTVTPAIFSPDDPYPDDRAAIRYELDRPGYRVTLRIIDRNGRPVRTLINGDYAGLEGALEWNGRNDRGSIPGAGIYILHFAAMNERDGRQLVRKEIVVLARRW